MAYMQGLHEVIIIITNTESISFIFMFYRKKKSKPIWKIKYIYWNKRRDQVTLIFDNISYNGHFWSLNSWFKPFNMMNILKCACKSNWTLFLYFFTIYKDGYKIRYFLLINSKKNIQFNLCVHLNVSIILSGIDLLFVLQKF
jgi:hypothetical protein